MNAQLWRAFGRLVVANQSTNYNTTNYSPIYSNVSNQRKLLDESQFHVRNHSSVLYKHHSGQSRQPRIDEEEITLLKVPKFIQAILTILICAIILSTVLCLILRTKYWYRNRSQQSRNGSAIVLEAISVPDQRTNENSVSESTTNYESIDPASNKHGKGRDRSVCLDSRPRTSRRGSGPFGDDALEFAHQTYKSRMKPSLQRHTSMTQEPVKVKASSKLQQENGTGTNV